VPLTGTIEPTGALVFDGVAETTTARVGRLTNSPRPSLGTGSPGISKQLTPSP
jgi:hypothetical protein